MKEDISFLSLELKLFAFYEKLYIHHSCYRKEMSNLDNMHNMVYYMLSDYVGLELSKDLRAVEPIRDLLSLVLTDANSC